jgi:hypothetical protein
MRFRQARGRFDKDGANLEGRNQAPDDTPDVQPEELVGWRAVVIGQEPAQGIHCGAVES